MSFFKKLFGGANNRDEKTDHPEFGELLAASMAGLKLLTSAHQNTWHFGEEESWDFSQDTGELVLTFPDKIVRAKAQIVGSYDSQAGTWMWSWANQSISENLTHDSIQVRQYGQEHCLRRLTEPSWSGEEIDGWQMTALACRLCESNGAYRGPAGETFVFFTFGEVQINKRGEQ